MAKIRNEQQRLGTEAVDIFKRSLPNEKLLDIVMEEIRNDYGLDVSIQIFKAEQHTGEIAYVQIKGQRELKLVKNKGYKQVMRTRDIQFLLETFQDPVLLVVSDIKTGKCYWLDLQVDPLTTQALIEAEHQHRQSLTLYLNPKNSLPETVNGFLAAISSSKLHLQEKAELRKLREIAKKDLSFSVKKLNEYADKLIDIPGFSIRPSEKSKTPLITLETNGGVNLSLYPNQDFKESMTPEVKMRFQVPITDKKSIKIIEGAKENPSLISQLNPKYISSFKIKAGEKILENYQANKTKSHAVKLSVNPITRDLQLFVRNKTNGKELTINTEMWTENNGFAHFSTPKNTQQLVQLQGKVNVATKEIILTFKMIPENFRNITNTFNILSLFQHLDKGLEFYINNGGFKTFLAEFKGEKTIMTDEWFNFYEKLFYIQSQVEEEIPAPPIDLNKEAIRNILMLYNAFRHEHKGPTLTTTVEIKDKKTILKTGAAVTVTATSCYIFGQELHFRGSQKLVFTGKVAEIEKRSKTLFKIKVTNTIVKIGNKK